MAISFAITGCHLPLPFAYDPTANFNSSNAELLSRLELILLIMILKVTEKTIYSLEQNHISSFYKLFK